jgi:hypothetical protein
MTAMANQFFFERESGNLALYVMAPASLVAILLGREGWHLIGLAQAPLYLVSGMYFPIRSLNVFVAIGASLVPLTLGLDAIRQLAFSAGPASGVHERPRGVHRPRRARRGVREPGLFSADLHGATRDPRGNADGEPWLNQRPFRAALAVVEDCGLARLAHRVELGDAVRVHRLCDREAAGDGGHPRRDVRGDHARQLRLAGVHLHYLGNAFYLYVGAVMSGMAWTVIDDRERYRMLTAMYVAPVDFR